MSRQRRAKGWTFKPETDGAVRSAVLSAEPELTRAQRKACIFAVANDREHPGSIVARQLLSTLVNYGEQWHRCERVPLSLRFSCPAGFLRAYAILVDDVRAN